MAASHQTTITSLKNRARQILQTLCNEPRDFELSRSLLASSIQVEHDSYPPTTDPNAFIASFQKLLQYMPDFHVEIIDLVAEVDEEEGGGKVWVFSKITGNGGKHCIDSVDMMTIDHGGKLVRSKDVQRVLNAEGSQKAA